MALSFLGDIDSYDTLVPLETSSTSTEALASTPTREFFLLELE